MKLLSATNMNNAFLRIAYFIIVTYPIKFSENANSKVATSGYPKMDNTTLSEIDFLGCKILGVQFNECRRFLLSFRFENCSLRLSVFYNLKLKEACFNKCDLQEADFTETDLTNASFQECNLYRAIFDHANLEKADFRTSNYYSINPETNRLKGARFSLNGLPGLLEQYGIIIE